MKMPESIITKFQLTPSGMQTGESFVQNQTLFKSDLPGFEDIIFMECDLTGKPAKEICFYNKANQFWGSITPETMEDVSVETILKIVR